MKTMRNLGGRFKHGKGVIYFSLLKNRVEKGWEKSKNVNWKQSAECSRRQSMEMEQDGWKKVGGSHTKLMVVMAEPGADGCGG